MTQNSHHRGSSHRHRNGYRRCTLYERVAIGELITLAMRLSDPIDAEAVRLRAEYIANGMLAVHRISDTGLKQWLDHRRSAR